MESFERSLNDKEDYIDKISAQNDQLKIKVTSLQLEIEGAYKTLDMLQEERDRLKVEVRGLQMDSERELCHIRS
jgi:peptidoglycan hydrolase CwlO-like protein